MRSVYQAYLFIFFLFLSVSVVRLVHAEETALSSSVFSQDLIQGELKNEKVALTIQGICFTWTSLPEKTFSINYRSLFNLVDSEMLMDTATMRTVQTLFFRDRDKKRTDTCYGLNYNEISNKPFVNVERLVNKNTQVNRILCEDATHWCIYSSGYDPSLGIPYEDFRNSKTATLEYYSSQEGFRNVSFPNKPVFITICSSFMFGESHKTSDLFQKAMPQCSKIRLGYNELISCKLILNNSDFSSKMSGQTECHFLLDPQRNYAIIKCAVLTVLPDGKIANLMVIHNTLTKVRDGFLPSETRQDAYTVQNASDNTETGKVIRTMSMKYHFIYDEKIPDIKVFTLDGFNQYGYRCNIFNSPSSTLNP